MAEELIETLMRFHREIVMPEGERAMDRRFAEQDAKLDRRFDRLNEHFDAIYHRFDRYDVEYTQIIRDLREIKEGLKKVE